jgi:nucleoside-diphosphate-sugar epimerase
MFKIGVVGTGSLGTAISESVHAAGHEVTTWSRGERSFIWRHFSGGFNANNLLSQFDYLIFAAGESRPDGISGAADWSNIKNFSDIIIENFYDGIVINLSSCAVYGSGSSPSCESLIPNPSTDYGVFKLKVENFFTSTFKDSAISLRIGNIINEQKPQGILAAILKSHREKSDVTLYGAATDFRDYLMAADLGLSVSSLLTQSNLPSILNIGSGQGLSLSDWELLIKRRTPEIRNVLWADRKNSDLACSILDVTLLQSLTNVRPREPFSEIEHILRNL